tara:strand:- start:968 stop:1384 length:417 start_codon:yes stop_codon:yes gene_type:complete
MTITVYTDGSCLKNPNGPGGWAFVVLEFDRIWEVSGGDKSTTNNRMELEAAIQTLEFLSNRDEDIIIYTDSKYVINGITTWIHNWIRKDWKKVKNVDLWKRLYILNSKRVEWKWVKGHSGDKYNDRADELAKMEAYLF